MATFVTSLLRSLEGIFFYAIDTDKHLKISLTPGTVIEITEESFLERIYTQSPNCKYEDELRTALSQKHFACRLTGPAGCGKTSVLRYVLHNLQRDGFLVLLVDVKAHVNLFSKPHDDETGVSNALALYLFNRYIDAGDRLAALAWMLTDGLIASNGVTADAFVELRNVGDRAHNGACEYLHKPTQIVSRPELDLALRSRPTLYDAVLNDATSVLQLRHVLAALQYLNDGKRIILALDNADRINLTSQVRLFTCAIDESCHLNDVGTVCIAVRSETKDSLARRLNFKGNICETVELGSAYAETISTQRLAHNKNVIQKRVSFIKDTLASLCAAPEERGVAEEVLSAFGEIVELHESLLGILSAFRVTVLSNQNLRDEASMFINFLTHLYEVEVASQQWPYRLSVKSLLRSDGGAGSGFLSTLFYKWTSRIENLRIAEVIKPDAEVDSARLYRDCASLEHLMISTCHNLNVSSQSATTAKTVGFCYERLRWLGFTNDEIASTLKRVVTTPGDQIRPLFLRTLDHVEDPKALDTSSAAEIGLTSVGIEILFSIFSKVGYCWGEIERRRSITMLELSPQKRLIELLRFFRHEMKQHLLLMVLAKTALQQSRGSQCDWLEIYLSHFAVGRRMQIERRLMDAHYYYRRQVASAGAWALDWDDIWKSYKVIAAAGNTESRLPYDSSLRSQFITDYSWSDGRITQTGDIPTPFNSLASLYRTMLQALSATGSTGVLQEQLPLIEAMVRYTTKSIPKWFAGAH